MSDLDVVMRGLMRDVGSALRPRGFRGSAGVWRLVTTGGVAVVEKQGSRGSAWDARLFYLNTAVVPTVWWEWRTGATGPVDRAGQADGIRLLEGRVQGTDPAHADNGYADRWRVAVDTDVDRLRVDLLAGVTHAAGRLAELLTPGRYLDELLAQPDKQVGHWEALVVLLAERGPSAELDAAYAGLRDAFADRPRAAGHVERVIGWAQARAAG
ncbi:DUF4304 domain-containing protein [Micromonospora echinofusca]|uniref:DUF4304 domain-containing protein n=1 Tax=Micromonospora echinofusca TaxID=47858 RepID=A0ABS3VPE6_MICEH|nr:DUF4304 domain-containing protein [Micromonospora echinofusca]MBO4206402.1 DUF4304 domain-containing protein [Micromonospora echinofusca]